MSRLAVLSEYTDWLPLIHGGGDDSGGGVLGLLDGVLESLTRLTDPGGFSGILGGIVTLGYNIHPMVVHFPIALITAYLFTDLLGLLRKNQSLHNTANWLLYLGAAGALAAVAAGLVAEQLVPHGAEVHDIMERHEFLGITVASLSVVLSLVRYLGGAALSTTMGLGLSWFMGLLMWVCLFFGADLGGTMVYQYGVGVHALQDAGQSRAHEHGGVRD